VDYLELTQKKLIFHRIGTWKLVSILYF